MAAYAALVSLMQTIEQIEQHPRPPIYLYKEQVESLTQKVTFLQEFLEGPYSMQLDGDSNEADPLEMRIADAAHAAENIIESNIFDQIHYHEPTSTCRGICCFEFLRCFGGAANARSTSYFCYLLLQRVIERDMDIILKEVMEIKERMRGVQHEAQNDSSISATPASTAHNVAMVGLDDVLTDVMDKLTRGQSDRQIIPVVGMGGIGKTTLARSIYHSQFAVEHFYIRSWVTISQEYEIKRILLKLLEENRGSLSDKNEHKLGEELHKSLCGRRYLIIIDDIWDIQVWDQLNRFFPDNNNGSTIMLTTRLAKLASQITNSPIVEMNFLGEDTGWDLFCRNVFGKEDCPAELEAIGKKIAKNCKGLPLPIVVVGGLLAKSEKTPEYWKYIMENVTSVVSLEGDEHCLKILHTSYKQLPAHLKPCFLHLAIFPEDFEIRVPDLIRLWVSEGFLKPIGGKVLEEVAQVYLEELIDRNLIFVEKCSFYGKIKSCKLHDLMRNVCLREAQKQKFVCVISRGAKISRGTNGERCISIHQGRRLNKDCRHVLNALESSPGVHSVHLMGLFMQPESPFRLRFLRVYSMDDGNAYYLGCEEKLTLEDIFQQVNLRYIDSHAPSQFNLFRSSFTRLWNLQTLILRNCVTYGSAPSEIWKMHQLRHVMVSGLIIWDLPTGCCSNDNVLKNLQSLSGVNDFECSKEVVRRIPNVKKLKLIYGQYESVPLDSFKNLENLHKLESFVLVWRSSRDLLHNFTFPRSLKKLTLEGTRLSWEYLTTKIGSIPLLQVLKLRSDAFKGHKWETIPGGFCSLKFLLISYCDLTFWETDYTHFPCLKGLILYGLKNLVEVPPSIGDIPTLQSIKLEFCATSASKSAIRILEEQEELANVDLKVHVFPPLSVEDEVEDE